MTVPSASEAELRLHLSDLHMDPDLLRWYDRDGHRIDVARFMFLQQFEEYIRIGKDRVADVWISTVWLGTDHNFRFAEERTPVIFETMLFCPGRDYWDNERWQYGTEADAVAGHLLVVASVRGEIGQLLP